ncbi:CcmD family protein [Hymenobacter sp. 15J16-1T3B]|uniref:CcmD family protein n=1 Tax=Hymenobacter sp. 15J16-1T3B TaxID=2886941 RepID=UPI001D11A9DF|nr:CcmD family protein [Hymenobacter sp. 15J16-1T3B]MCC3157883.1 CcmD family protein [Hymenobacter sp. 15J16-1T3B]
MKNNWLNQFSRRALLALAAVLLPLYSALAQAPEAGPEMADQLRQDGKIYVVVAVIVVIVVGLLAYLVSIDRKVSRLERELRD